MRSHNSLRIAALGTGIALAALAAPASAQDWQVARKGDWIVTGRITDVASSADDAITTAAGAATGLNVDVGDDVMPTLGFTYFLTDNISVEAILGATRHEIRAQGGTTDVAVHETWVLPPVVTLQYRPAPEARVSPYAGAGLNYMLFFSGEDRNGFDVKLDDGLGYALQAGADIAVSGPWTVNVDVKKVWFNTDATINAATLKSDVNLDPWVVSLGIGRKF
ncbi:outer membrane beta-barrel protein [Brevundimonas sp. AJA228-03]|uniref:OmpW/AlkL family protein n=1 Tax=Brevundimonas sp. AJA228-03 TaxID=2752515 RepID=UPI001AE098A7|nr:OmpW family outer membrane protein [Brevundimonas sp. AJA228-03]QTN20959.1 outer membrane beta-barrel protein [Brevundimonas sp. AJA228-03]